MQYTKTKEAPSNPLQITDNDVERLLGKPSALLTDYHLASLTGISRSWFMQARARGEGPHWMKLGRSVRYTLASVNEWLATGGAPQAQTPTSPRREEI